VPSDHADHLWVDLAGLDALVRVLLEDGYTVIGPQVQDGAIVYDELEQAADLPAGWTDEQAPGHYRLHRRDDGARFGYALPPQSPKRQLHPPEALLWQSRRAADGALTFEAAPPDALRFAFIGVRACELAAIARQDRVLRDGPVAEPTYAARRAGAFVVAVPCSDPASTCFCSSMGTGPAVEPQSGEDLTLTEVLSGGVPSYLVGMGSETGRAVMDRVPHRAATVVEVRAAERVSEQARARISRRLDGLAAPATAASCYAAYDDSARWQSLGERCLTCGNCTMVCPTCFCTTVADSTDLSTERAERVRVWDSCFGLDFSHLASGPVRPSAGARYRHWFVHKLAAWHDQFGSSGCVGCGRCIAWCPVGIDLMDEARRLLEAAADGQPVSLSTGAAGGRR
jgi:ferredoxin